MKRRLDGMGMSFALVLGWGILAGSGLWGEGPDGGEAGEATEITSEFLEMVGSEKTNLFVFEGAVEVRSESLEMTCDEMRVTASRSGDPGATIGKIGVIEHILATGHVHIRQAGREAFAGKAEIEPETGLLILEDDPRIVDGETVVSGWRITLSREKKIDVQSDPSAAGQEGKKRATVKLGDSVGSFNFNREENTLETEGNRMTAPAGADEAVKEGNETEDREQAGEDPPGE